MTTQVYGVPTEQIETVWPILHEFLASALLKGSPVPETTPELIKERLLIQQQQAWVAIKDDSEITAVMTTYIAQGDIFKKLIVDNIAGVEMESWLPFWDLVEDYAKDKGVDQILIRGRKGWARKLKSIGFQEQYVTLAKTI